MAKITALPWHLECLYPPAGTIDKASDCRCPFHSRLALAAAVDQCQGGAGLGDELDEEALGNGG
eukprot:2696532-Pyramimonas_sp.AAC.1